MSLFGADAQTGPTARKGSGNVGWPASLSTARPPGVTLGQRPAVAAFGGGHGLYASLSALRRVTDRLTAIVTVADDGGSSGRLRAELNCLPPGDLRMALAALCGDDESGRVWADVLQYRFAGTGPLGDHAIGNLLIAGLWERLGDPIAGLDMVARLLKAEGRVLPMAAVPLEIEAEVIGLDPMRPDEISYIRGQAQVAKTTAEVRAVHLHPENPPACPESLAAIMEADWVVLGPGSWFTSVIPHLLVPQLAHAILDTRAQRLLTLNLEPAGETAGFSPARHIELLAEHAPDLRLDVVLADERFAADDPHLAAFAESLGARLILADLAVRDGSPRHDPLRLAAAYAEIMTDSRVAS
ncbi:MAG: uridine diphosphate-N-acetylglucosamine-binding protein YvcK [Propionibacteriaceae bacterium]